jgi:hypothetical protein
VPGSLYATHVAQPMNVVACCGWRARCQACIYVYGLSFDSRFLHIIIRRAFYHMHLFDQYLDVIAVTSPRNMFSSSSDLLPLKVDD